MNNEIVMNTYTYGTYYNPATNHYGKPTTIVRCDRCQRTPLKTCIGWISYDLCLRCMLDIEKTLSESSDISDSDTEVCTLMEQSNLTLDKKDQFYIPPKKIYADTRMEQAQFSTPSKIPYANSRMEQSQFSTPSKIPYANSRMEQSQFFTVCAMMEQGQFSDVKNKDKNKDKDFV
ncbi:MAG: hypothetical protein Homavirus2_8 [Homavirus sp.]|uniref:Uncharacterized protein n=1 Tax=Homavirus sp. TaxID=2487769 RepID=A0A3G5A687_9VIRU|nr:MAG: hypothetical protein Homavirus2_8 [Homavirus sp.]